MGTRSTLPTATMACCRAAGADLYQRLQDRGTVAWVVTASSTLETVPVLNLTQFTIEGWVRLDGILGGGYNMAILWKGNSGGADISTPFAIAVCGSTCAATGDRVTPGGLQSGTAKLGRPFVMLSNGVIEHQIFTNTVLPVGAFVHLGVTLSDGLVQVLINGQIDSSSPTSIVPFNSSFPLQIGGVGNPSLHPAGFPGVTDELAIYSRALTGDEIRRIYEAGSAGKCKTGVPPVNVAPIITSAPGTHRHRRPALWLSGDGRRPRRRCADLFFLLLAQPAWPSTQPVV